MHRFLLLSLLLLTGCDFGDPSEVAGRTEAALREYFPRASAVVQPQNSTIYGMTCVDLGRKLVGQIAPVLASSPEVKRLRSLRKLEWLPGNHTYRYFVVGFEKQLVVYDVDKDDVLVRDAEADYEAIYRQRCYRTADAGGLVPLDFWAARYVADRKIDCGSKTS